MGMWDDCLFMEYYNSAYEYDSGLEHGEVVEALLYTKTRDMRRHYSELERVAAKLDFELGRPEILLISSDNGRIGPAKRTTTIGKSPVVYVPRLLDDKSLELTGFYAHELSHLCLGKDKDYVRLRDKAREATTNSRQILLEKVALAIPNFLNWRILRTREELMVDAYAKAHGFADEIVATRKLIPLKLEFPRFYRSKPDYTVYARLKEKGLWPLPGMHTAEDVLAGRVEPVL